MCADLNLFLYIENGCVFLYNYTNDEESSIDSAPLYLASDF